PKITSKRTDGYLFATIQNGGMVMPSLAHRLSARATWDVVNYLRSIEESAPKQAGISPGAGAVSFQADAPPGAAGQPPPAQRASVVRGDAGRGKQVFEENCSLCHDPTSDQAGIGPGLKGLFQWPPHKLSDGTEHAKHTVELIRKQVTQGGGQME